MILSTEKLESMSLSYDLLSNEKKDLTKEENMEFTPAPKDFCRSHLLYSILIATLLLLVSWMLLTPRYYDVGMQLAEIDNQVYETTKNVVNDAEFILNEIKKQMATMSEKNKQAAVKYVAGIRDILKQRTIYGVKRLSQLISAKTTNIESELLVFDQEIITMNNGNLDVTQLDIAKLRQEVNAIELSDAAESLNKILTEVENEIQEFCHDMNQMYSWYGNYVSDIIDHKVENITDDIRMKMMAERRSLCCTEFEHINFCYNISSHNAQITQQLESVIQVTNIINNSTDTVNSLSSLFTKDGEEYPPPMMIESKHILEKVSDEAKSVFDSLLKGEEYYLGTMVRKLSYQDQKHLKNFKLKSYRTVITDLSTYVNKTIADFKIVRDEHWTRINEVLFPALKNIGDDMKTKATLINDTTIRDEYMKKAEFESLKIWLHDQFVNVTSVVNSLVERRKGYTADMIDLDISYILNQKLPFISSFSVGNYLPSDVCPLSVDYQQFILAMLEEYPHTPESHLIRQMFNIDGKPRIGNATSAFLPLDNLEVEVEVEVVDGDDSSEESSSNSFMQLIQSVLKAIVDAGYSVDVYIDDSGEDKQEK